MTKKELEKLQKNPNELDMSMIKAEDIYYLPIELKRKISINDIANKLNPLSSQDIRKLTIKTPKHIKQLLAI